MEQTKKTIGKTGILCRYAVCVALLVVCAQIYVPLPFTAVPVTLATFMVFLIGGLLGPFRGALCVLLYIFMGAIGIPVFSGFKAFSALIGPTGGYIFGYIPMVMTVGVFLRKFSAPILHLAGMVAGIALCYVFGALWYAYLSGISFVASLMLTVVPFIAADAFKLILAFLIINRLVKIPGIAL